MRGNIKDPSAVAPASHRSHVVLIAISLRGNKFTLSVINTGKAGASSTDGLNYHPTKFDETSGKIKRQVMLTIYDIPRFRLLDSSFWFMLLRLKALPGEGNTCTFLYQTLLPYLNSTPLRANKCYTDPSSAEDAYCSVRATKDASFFSSSQNGSQDLLLASWFVHAPGEAYDVSC